MEDIPPGAKSEPAERKKKESKDRKVRAVTGLSVSNEILKHVTDAQRAKKMWNAIKNDFKHHTLVTKLAASKKFYTVKTEIERKC